MSEQESAATEHAVHKREFTVGDNYDLAEFQELVNQNMERLANRVERDCEVKVTIEVFDLE